MGTLSNKRGDLVKIEQKAGLFWLTYIPADPGTPIRENSFIHFNRAMDEVAAFLFPEE